jgi:hypothetical protein
MSAAKKMSLVSARSPERDAAVLTALCQLENPVCDLHRLARIAMLLVLHELENPDKGESLTMTVLLIIEQRTKELRDRFDLAICSPEEALRTES